MHILITFLIETVNIWLEMAVYILLGCVIAGMMHLWAGREFIQRQLGKGGWFSIIKATLLGIPLPVCSCGVIPLAQSLKKEGAHRSSVLSFLVSTPTTGVDSILATYALLGPLFAIFRPLAALCMGILLGGLDYVVEGKEEKHQPVVVHGHRQFSFSFQVKEFMRYSFVEIPADIGKWLLLGTVIGGLISTIIPQSFLQQYMPFPFDFLAALLVGIPLYVCATGSIPIAASLIAKGFSPGAGLVFLIAGPATNAITIAFVKTQLGKKALYLYLSSITIVSLLMGLLLNLFWVNVTAHNPHMLHGAGEHLPAFLKISCAVILFVLVGIPYIRRKSPACPADMEFSVEDIHCKHCQMSIEEKVNSVPGVEYVNVDIQKKKVLVGGHADPREVMKKIEEAGYHPRILVVKDTCNCGS